MATVNQNDTLYINVKVLEKEDGTKEILYGVPTETEGSFVWKSIASSGGGTGLEKKTVEISLNSFITNPQANTDYQTDINDTFIENGQGVLTSWTLSPSLIDKGIFVWVSGSFRAQNQYRVKVRLSGWFEMNANDKIIFEFAKQKPVSD